MINYRLIFDHQRPNEVVLALAEIISKNSYDLASQGGVIEETDKIQQERQPDQLRSLCEALLDLEFVGSLQICRQSMTVRLADFYCWWEQPEAISAIFWTEDQIKAVLEVLAIMLDDDPIPSAVQSKEPIFSNGLPKGYTPAYLNRFSFPQVLGISRDFK